MPKSILLESYPANMSWLFKCSMAIGKACDIRIVLLSVVLIKLLASFSVVPNLNLNRAVYSLLNSTRFLESFSSFAVASNEILRIARSGRVFIFGVAILVLNCRLISSLKFSVLNLFAGVLKLHDWRRSAENANSIDCDTCFSLACFSLVSIRLWLIVAIFD